MTARGFRNNNPGNIKDNGIPWEGLAIPSEMTVAQKRERVFCVFRGPWWGIRAIAVIVRNYGRRYGLRTVSGIIDRWAPPSDSNPTRRYVLHVAGRLAVRSDQEIDLDDYETMRRLCEAIVYFENGEDPYDREYDVGLILAGLEPPGGVLA